MGQKKQGFWCLYLLMNCHSVEYLYVYIGCFSGIEVAK